ncbi:MAG: (2Fe-2S)-binding protein [Pirellulaceae bacterium]|nr:MAG: (2Fe-2S)-binding protein [Pirellulaceae bacterium]
MARWVLVGLVTDFPEGEAREVVAEGRVLALFCVDGSIYALDGVCPHQGGPLGRGSLRGCIVTCPWHGWQYDVRTGQHQSIPSLVHRSYPVQIRDNQVFVDVDS